MVYRFDAIAGNLGSISNGGVHGLHIYRYICRYMQGLKKTCEFQYAMHDNLNYVKIMVVGNQQ